LHLKEKTQQYNKQKEDFRNLEKQRDQLVNEIEKLNTLLTNYQNENQTIQEQLNLFIQKEEQLNEQVKDRETLTNKIEKLQLENKYLNEAQMVVSTQLDQTKKEKNQNDDKLLKALKAMLESQTRIAELELDQSNKQEKIENLEKERANHLSEISKLTHNTDLLRKEIQETILKHSTHSKTIAKMEKLIISLQKKIKDLEHE
jgi:chromosome segregation ATPase